MKCTDLNEIVFRDLDGTQRYPKMFILGKITYISIETYMAKYTRGVKALYILFATWHFDI